MLVQTVAKHLTKHDARLDDYIASPNSTLPGTFSRAFYLGAKEGLADAIFVVGTITLVVSAIAVARNNLKTNV